MGEMRLQCAWCRRLYDADGMYLLSPPDLLPDASHGLCPSCLSAMLKKESERCARSGDQLRALHVEQQRLRLLSATAMRRRTIIAERMRALRSASASLLARTRDLLNASRARRRAARHGDQQRRALP
jgi:hypothetical protein